MKKIFAATLFIALSFLFSNVKAQPNYVKIPDTNFVSWLQIHYPSCMKGDMIDTTCIEIVNEDSLDVSSWSISNLFGIQYFDKLKFLICHNFSLINLPILPDSLTFFDCSGCSILEQLPTLPTSLTVLICTGNSFTSLPPLPTSLTDLNCSYNYITVLPAFPTALTNLNCEYNSLTSLSDLPSSLTNLNCEYNSLTSLPALPSLLTNLNCHHNSLKNLPALPSSLTDLVCSDNFLDSLPSIYSSLINLNCRYNSLTSLPDLPSSLTYLDCYNNSLTSLPDIPSSLIKLDCSYNSLISLPALPSLMTHLDCHHNSLTSLPALPSSLTYLVCAMNPNLNCFPVLTTFNGSLTYSFNISKTGIKCLPNEIDHPNIVSLPAIDTMRLCEDFNPNSCFFYTSVTESTNSNFSIYPNPTTGRLTISNLPLGIDRLEIKNILGQSVLTKSIPTPVTKTEINVSDLSQGIYFIHFHSNNGDVVKKIVKE